MKKLRFVLLFISFVFGNSLFLLQAAAEQERGRIAGVNQQPSAFMPNLIAKDANEAEREVKKLVKGLSVEKIEVENSRFQPGQVVEQSPSPQTALYPQTRVVLRFRKRDSQKTEKIVNGIFDAIRPALERTTVPDVRGKSVSQAKEILTGRRLRAGIRSRGEEEDSRLVAEQFPEPGRRVSVNSSVSLTLEQQPKLREPVRSGPPPPKTTTVPNVIGQQEGVARQLIERADLIVGTVINEEAPQGWGLVWRQSLPPRTVVDRRSTVNLVIAAQPKPVTVPNLRNMSLSQAERELSRVGLNRGFVVGVSANAPGAQVVDQSRAAGAQVERGRNVGMTLGLPPTPVPSPSPIVPNLRGQTLVEASQNLKGVGLRLVQDTTQPSNSLPGTIAAQRPPAGTSVAVGSAVSVVLAVPTPTPLPTVTTSPTPIPRVVPDVRGKTREEAEQILRAAGLRLGQAATRPANSSLGTVLEQRPLPGEQAEDGSAVNLVLASAMAATPTPITPPSTPSNDWLGKLIQDIPKALAVAGLGFFGLLLAWLIKRLFKRPTPPTPPPLTEPIPPTVKPNIEYRTVADVGTQAIETTTKLSLPIEFSLRPKSDVGRQWIEAVGQLIASERSEA